MNSNFWGGWPDAGVGVAGGGTVTFPGGVLILGGAGGTSNSQPVYQQNRMADLMPLILIGVVLFFAFRR